jgi:hypothetical protein
MAGIALVLFLIHRLYNKIIPNDNKVCRFQL